MVVLLLVPERLNSAHASTPKAKTIRIGMVVPSLTIKAIADLANGAKARAPKPMTFEFPVSTQSSDTTSG